MPKITCSTGPSIAPADPEEEVYVEEESQVEESEEDFELSEEDFDAVMAYPAKTSKP